MYFVSACYNQRNTIHTHVYVHMCNLFLCTHTHNHKHFQKIQMILRVHELATVRNITDTTDYPILYSEAEMGNHTSVEQAQNQQLVDFCLSNSVINRTEPPIPSSKFLSCDFQVRGFEESSLRHNHSFIHSFRRIEHLPCTKY